MTAASKAERDVSFPETSLAGELVRRREGLTRIRAYLVTDKKLSTRARDWPEGEVAGIPVEFHIWDIERLYNAHVSLAGRDDIDIDFSGHSRRRHPLHPGWLGRGRP